MAKNSRYVGSRLATMVNARYYPDDKVVDAYFLDGRFTSPSESRAAQQSHDREDRGFLYALFAYPAENGTAVEQTHFAGSMQKLMRDVKRGPQSIDTEINDLADLAIEVGGKATLAQEGVRQSYFTGLIVKEGEIAAVTTADGCAFLYRSNALYPLTAGDFDFEAIDVNGNPIQHLHDYAAGVAGTIRYSNLAQIQAYDSLVLCNKAIVDILGQREMLRILADSENQEAAASALVTAAAAKRSGVSLQVLVANVDYVEDMSKDDQGQVQSNAPHAQTPPPAYGGPNNAPYQGQASNGTANNQQAASYAQHDPNFVPPYDQSQATIRYDASALQVGGNDMPENNYYGQAPAPQSGMKPGQNVPPTSPEEDDAFAAGQAYAAGQDYASASDYPAYGQPETPDQGYADYQVDNNYQADNYGDYNYDQYGNAAYNEPYDNAGYEPQQDAYPDQQGAAPGPYDQNYDQQPYDQYQATDDYAQYPADDYGQYSNNGYPEDNYQDGYGNEPYQDQGYGGGDYYDPNQPPYGDGYNDGYYPDQQEDQGYYDDGSYYDEGQGGEYYDQGSYEDEYRDQYYNDYQQNYYDDAYGDYYEDDKKEKTKRIVFYVILVAIIAVCIFILVRLIGGSDKNNPVESTSVKETMAEETTEAKETKETTAEETTPAETTEETNKAQETDPLTGETLEEAPEPGTDTENPNPSTPGNAQAQSYVVKAGDTFYAIISSYYQRTDSVVTNLVLEANPQISNPDFLTEGMEILLPPIPAGQ